MKVYARKDILPIDIPVGNIQYNNPAAVQHFKDFNAIISLQHLGDYSSSYLLVNEDLDEDIPFGIFRWQPSNPYDSEQSPFTHSKGLNLANVINLTCKSSYLLFWLICQD